MEYLYNKILGPRKSQTIGEIRDCQRQEYADLVSHYELKATLENKKKLWLAGLIEEKIRNASVRRDYFKNPVDYWRKWYESEVNKISRLEQTILGADSTDNEYEYEENGYEDYSENDDSTPYGVINLRSSDEGFAEFIATTLEAEHPHLFLYKRKYEPWMFQRRFKISTVNEDTGPDSLFWINLMLDNTETEGDGVGFDMNIVFTGFNYTWVLLQLFNKAVELRDDILQRNNMC